MVGTPVGLAHHFSAPRPLLRYLAVTFLQMLYVRDGAPARAAILEYWDDLKDVFLAERRLEDLREGSSETVPLLELTARYGVDD